MWKNEYSWNPSSCICENSGYLKNLADNSVLRCNEIVSVTDSVSTNVTSTISINVTSTVLINFDDKKVWFKMDYHILHMFLLETILLFMTAIICYHYEKHGQNKKILGH